MLALLSVPPRSVFFFFFQLYSVQKYFAINMKPFSKDSTEGFFPPPLHYITCRLHCQLTRLFSLASEV